MPIKINYHRMSLESSGSVASWPRRLRREEAITTLTITELLAFGRNSSDPAMTSLRAELMS
jgi:hypothetical protein